jgi:2-oxo-3-hexenedioate decarboxylase
MWDYVYDTTVRELRKEGADASLSGLAEPRIEPEIVFGMAAAPAPDMDARALLGCVDWVAHGFEIVQSIFPRWKFLAADTIAAYGLHGALWVGPRHSIAPRARKWERELEAFEIGLFRNGLQVDRGRAANVLDGPVFALRHLVELLADDPLNPPLAPRARSAPREP